MSRTCSSCGCAPDEKGVCSCAPPTTYTCGHCGSDVAIGEDCYCIGNASQNSSAAPAMAFEPLDGGFRITFENGWAIKAEMADVAEPQKVKIQTFTPQGFLVRAFSHEHVVVNCNDLAVVLMQTSAIAKGEKFTEDQATQSFEAMIEGLLFGVAA